jgi:uncharacterized protein
MPPTELPETLCVSLHDVAPQTWPQCLQLLQAIWSVADIPVTLLVVPAYHKAACYRGGSFESLLDDLLVRGNELALHGYTHLDDGPPAQGLRNIFWRNIFTQQEGEFSALDAAEARHRLELGLDWFAQRHWPVSGFVAPAWLLNAAAWQVLQDFPFLYTTTIGYFHLLPERHSLFSPSLVYTARNSAGRALSPSANSLLATVLHAAPLVRLSLHPQDAAYPKLVLYTQRLLEKLLASREAMTKASFAEKWRQVMTRQVS